MTLVLDHYLEVLRRKPGALPGATALAQARRAGTFTSEHDAFWEAARHALGDAEGTRELVDVLLLHRRYPHAAVVAGIAAAVSAGAVRADVVAVETRRRTDRHDVHQLQAGEDLPGGGGLEAAAAGRRVVSLTRRRLADPAAVIAGLPPDPRPLPTVDAYDQLLVGRSQEVS
jgi:hypothetical protein